MHHRFSALALVALTGCSTTGPHFDRLPKTAIGHSVYFTLNTSNPSTIAELVADCHSLAEIPSVHRLEAGPITPRVMDERADREFHVALRIVFLDSAAHDRYVIHPTHRAVTRKWHQRIRRVRVFDSHPGE